MNIQSKKRQEKIKELILEHLRKTPIVQIACDKAGISRSSYYRWRNEDLIFLRQSDQSLLDGSLLVNDMAESQLMSAIKDKNMTAIIFWLKHHHPKYTPRFEITAHSADNLSEQEVNDLAKLLYEPKTFKQGQELLTTYVIKGAVSEKFAQLVLRMFISQLRADDILSRKAEADVMAEVMLRKN